jgi:hypothetical protein
MDFPDGYQKFSKRVSFFWPGTSFRLSGVPEIKEDPASRIESYLR